MRKLFEPADGASLAVFRFAFGAIMVWEVCRYFSHGWIQRYYITPSFHFGYYGLEWIRPWPGPGMHLHFAALGALAVAVALGFRYRLAAALFFAGFTYVFLLDQARYLNHFYLICLISFVLIFVPAHRTWSLDAARGPGPAAVPAWALWLVRFQVGLPYFYGGVAKLNADWFRGEPLRTWMAARSETPVFGPLLTREPVVDAFVYGALAFDLLIVPLLLWRRSRTAAFVLACAFHLMNAQLFTIGVFPFLMIAATTVFFEPDWPRRVLRLAIPARGGSRDRRDGSNAEHAKHAEIGSVSAFSAGSALNPSLRPVLALRGALLLAYVALQVLVPLRHHLYPGDVNWTEEGHRFSWRMKLRDKEARARFFASDRTAQTDWEIDWRAYLATWQYEEMCSRPDMILQFAHHAADRLRRETGRAIEVRAVVSASLNGAPPRLLIDPRADLAAQPRSLMSAAWVVR